MPRNPDHAVNLLERIRDKAFNVYARRGDYAMYYSLVNATLGPITEGRPVHLVKDGVLLVE